MYKGNHFNYSQNYSGKCLTEIFIIFAIANKTRLNWSKTIKKLGIFSIYAQKEK